ncbi:MAG TPA: SCO family protein [Campylobacter avium]|uniref:SCO family protein n=1 Tax=Campylobacter avium TaxID=522485 RepID=UPI001D5EB45F|nr:SCO family protein [Campylobacter avium]HJE65629.1 SCO family protein [Campylobacter avium]
MKKKLVFSLVFLLLLLSFYVFYAQNKYDFALISQDNIVSLKDFKGEKLIVYFGYTNCPDVCPATLSLLTSELKKQDKNPKLLFISLDIEADKDLQKSSEWLRYFYENSVFLLAKNEDELRKISKNYGVHYEKIDMKDSALKYTVAHSNFLFLFDENSNFLGKISNLSQNNLKKELSEFLR